MPHFYSAIARSAGRADVELCCAPAACVFDGFLDWLPKALSIFASASYPSLCASRRTGAAIRRALHQRKPHGHTTHHLPASNHWVAECNMFANTKYLAQVPSPRIPSTGTCRQLPRMANPVARRYTQMLLLLSTWIEALPMSSSHRRICSECDLRARVDKATPRRMANAISARPCQHCTHVGIVAKRLHQVPHFADCHIGLPGMHQPT